jgi:PAS domain S-box-containing protein
MSPRPMLDILLIEDSPTDVLLVRESLAQDKFTEFRVTVAETLDQGLSVLRQAHFDVVLLDLGLPDSVGLTTFERWYAQAPDAPVLICSGANDEEIAVQAVRMGAQDYLVKDDIQSKFVIRAIRYAIERHKLNCSLYESEQRFSTAFFTNPVAQSIIDPINSKITTVNHACCQMFGYCPEELIDANPAKLALWANPADELSALEELQRTGHLLPRETAVRVKSGEVRTVMAAIEPISWKGIPCFITTTLDITERKQAELARERQAGRLEILHQLDAAILANQSIEQISNTTLELLAQMIPFDLGGAALFDATTMQYQLVALQSILPITLPMGVPVPVDAKLLPTVMNLGTSIVENLADYIDQDHTVEPLVAAGLQSMVHSSLSVDGVTFGGIRLFSRTPNGFAAEHANILTEVTSQFAIAIAQVRMREQIQKHTAELEERVRQATAQVEDLYNNAPGGYHSLDGQGNLIYINDTELKWLGRTRAQVLGHSFAEFIAPHQVEQFLTRHLPVIKSGKSTENLEYDLVRGNGTTLPILLKAVTVLDDAGNFVMTRATLVDITERKQAEQAVQFSRDQLDLANRELARASKLKDEFLANMSHELRTPLNAILGLSQSLSEQLIGPLNQRQLEAIAIVESSGKHLLALINDILDLSKIEAGNMTLDLEPVAVGSVCQTSLVFIKQIAHKKNIGVTSRLDSAVEWIQVDERRLKQMLVNLLTNAVKFTPAGGKVELAVTGSHSQNTVQFSVRDTGIGIAPEDLTRLFKPFMQVDSSMTRQFEGTGLGLSLVMHMAELHGGSVTVESELGTGSVFTIILPWNEMMQKYSQVLTGASPATVAAPTQTPAVSQPADAHAPLILIAEDNEANITMLSLYLNAKGYRLAIARYGGEALDVARSEHPALILMDLQMPVLDGLEATRRLRRETDPRIAGIPIIALTALVMPGDRERAIAAGVNEYMSKPVELSKLAKLIQQFIPPE